MKCTDQEDCFYSNCFNLSLIDPDHITRMAWSEEPADRDSQPGTSWCWVRLHTSTLRSCISFCCYKDRGHL